MKYKYWYMKCFVIILIRKIKLLVENLLLNFDEEKDRDIFIRVFIRMIRYIIDFFKVVIVGLVGERVEVLDEV